MTASAPEQKLEERVERLERRLEETIATLGSAAGRGEPFATAVERPGSFASTSMAGPEPGLRGTSASDGQGGALAMSSAQSPATRRSEMSLSDLVGGRWLAWIGGVATLLGIVLFLALAISHGWLGREARVALAGAAAGALIAAGIWLHGRRGRTEAAMVMVGAGTAGLFATLLVASEVYALMSPLLGVTGSMVVGGVATGLAIRWAGRAIGALGLGGGLVSPLLVGASNDGVTIAILAVATACALLVVVWQRWGWLAVATPLVSAPQWASWMLNGHSGLVDVLVLVLFAALGLGAAIGTQRGSSERRLQPAATTLMVLNACITAVIGRLALSGAAGAPLAGLWLVALAGAHAVLAVWRSDRIALTRPSRRLLIAISIILADVAFGLSTHGIALALGWGATAVAFGWLARRTTQNQADEVLLDLGVGAHIGLVLLRVLVTAPPTHLANGNPQLLQLLTIATLAASCLACGRLSGPDQRSWRAALDILGLATIAYLAATALDGPSLVAAWTVEGVALAQLHRRTHDQVAQLGALAFLTGAALHTLAIEAPASALLTGVPALAGAAVALGVIAAALLRTGYLHPSDSTPRRWLFASSATTLLYLASVTIVTNFQPTAATALASVLDLSIRQQGQVVLSALWSLTGLAALILGLRSNTNSLRTAGLALLLLTVAKVFLYDLSTLTSIYRVISVIVLGLLLLAGAFAYQRLRPPPPPDMRTLHPSQR